MTARASRRAVEVGVRKALAPSARTLIVQFMGEALIYVAIAWSGGRAGRTAAARSERVAAAQDRVQLPDRPATPLHGGRHLVTALLAGSIRRLSCRPSVPRPSSKVVVAIRAGGGVRGALVVAQFAVLIALLLAR